MQQCVVAYLVYAFNCADLTSVNISVLTSLLGIRLPLRGTVLSRFFLENLMKKAIVILAVLAVVAKVSIGFADTGTKAVRASVSKIEMIEAQAQ